MLASTSPLVNPLLLNLERYVRLSIEDRDEIDKLKSAPAYEIRARSDLIHEGQNPSVVRLIVSGWACRYKDLLNGRRQIVGIFVPGDFCDLNVYILRQMDHSIGAITPVKYLAIPPDMIERLTHRRPRVAQALLWHNLVEASVAREWLLNIGQRSAVERLGHLLVELLFRLRAIGMAQEDTIDFPLTQTDLAEVTGVTPVHINRTLKELRSAGLIELKAKRLKILDLEQLMGLSMFNPNYLHLDREGRHLDSNE